MWSRSEWRRRWGSLLLLAALIAIAGGATITAASAARRTDTAFDRMLETTNAPNLEVSALTDTEIGDLDPALLDRVMQIDGVRGATEIAFVAVSPLEYPVFFSLAYLEERGEFARPIYVDGPARGQIADMGADEVLINESMSKELQVGAGATLQLQSATAEQFLAAIADDVELGEPEGPAISARVVGVGRTPEDISDAPDPFLVFSRAFYEKYHDSLWTCRCIVRILAQADSIDEVAAELAVIYPSAIIAPTENLGERLSDTVALQVSTWIVMALTAALSGALILLLACARFVRSLTGADFTHRSLGMTQRDSQVGRVVIIAPAIVLGSLGAGALAYSLSPFDPVGITRRAEPAPGLHWYWSIGGFGIVAVFTVGLLVAGVCSVVVRHRAEVVPRGVPRGGPVAALGSRLAVGPGRGAVLGVLIASLGAFGAMTLDHSIDHMLTTPTLYGADFDANVLEVVGNDELAVAQELATDPDIEAVASMWTSDSADNEEGVHFVGPDGDFDITPNAIQSVKGTVDDITVAGRAPLLADEVALGRGAMQQLGVGIGGVVTVDGQNGPLQFKVVGQVISLGVDSTGNGLAVTLDGLASVVEPGVSLTAVRYAPGADRAAVAARHPNLDIRPVVPPSEVGNIGELGDLPTSVAQLLLLLGTVALLSAVVATISHGRREIAIHRALGFTTSQVVGAHLWQNAATTVVGGAIGGSIGFVVGRAIHHKLANDVGAIADTVVPASLWSVGLVAGIAMLILAIVTSALTLRSRPGAVLRAE